MKSVNVRLCNKDGFTVLKAVVQATDEGKMPRFLLFDGMVFQFDNGLQHCGERYSYFHDIVEVKSEMVTYRPPIKVTVTASHVSEVGKWPDNVPPISPDNPMPTEIVDVFGDVTHRGTDKDKL